MPGFLSLMKINRIRIILLSPGFSLLGINRSRMFLPMPGFHLAKINWNGINLPMPGFCLVRISWRINLPMPGFGLVKINWSRIEKIHDTKDCSCDRSTARRRRCDKGQSLILQLNQKLIFFFLALLYINLKTSSMIKGFKVKWMLLARYCKPSDSTPNNSNMILHNEILIGNFRYDGI